MNPIAVETNLGILNIQPKCADLIHAYAGTYGTTNFRVQGKNIQVRMELGFYNGKWSLKRTLNGNPERGCLTLLRPDGGDVSLKTREKIELTVEDAVNLWYNSDPEAVAAADAEHWLREIASKQEQVEEAKKKVRELEQEVAVMKEDRIVFIRYPADDYKRAEEVFGKLKNCHCDPQWLCERGGTSQATGDYVITIPRNNKPAADKAMQDDDNWPSFR